MQKYLDRIAELPVVVDEFAVIAKQATDYIERINEPMSPEEALAKADLVYANLEGYIHDYYNRYSAIETRFRFCNNRIRAIKLNAYKPYIHGLLFI